MNYDNDKSNEDIYNEICKDLDIITNGLEEILRSIEWNNNKPKSEFEQIVNVKPFVYKTKDLW